MNKILTKSLAFTLVTVGVLLCSHSAEAMILTPLRLEMSGNPGDTLSNSFKIYNDSDKAQTYTFGTGTFEARGEDGEPTFVDQPGGLAEWIQKPGDVTVAPRTYQVINFSVIVPKDAEPGGYFAGILTNIKAPEVNGKQSQVFLSPQVGELVLFRVNGEVKEGADLLEYDTLNHKHFYTELPVEFYYRFQNGGGSWLKPLGDVVISNTFGGTTKIINANPFAGDVLPKSIRKFKAGWYEAGGPTQQDDKIFSAPVPPKGFWNNVVFEFQHFAFGRYTAKLTLVYGDTSQVSVNKKIAFWIFPWQLLIVATLVILLSLAGIISIAVWIVYKIIRRFEKK